MNWRLCASGCLLPLLLTSCPGWLGLNTDDAFAFRRPAITSAKGNEIKVGEETSLQIRLEWTGNPALVAGQRCFAFMYSKKNANQPFFKSDGFDVVIKNVKNDLADYPVDPPIQGSNPASNATNVVPLLETTIKPGKLLEATFIFKAVQPGNTILGGSFVCESFGKFGQGQLDRMTENDATWSVTVIP
jgi:hypothetical protein